MKETESKCGCLEKYSFYDWKPVKLLEVMSMSKELK